MARAAEVSRDQIIEAGKALSAEGKRINGWSLRSLIGSGRPERLEAVWNEYLKEGGTAADEAAVEPDQTTVLPPHVHEKRAEWKAASEAHLDGLVISIYRFIETDLKAIFKADFDRLAAERQEMTDKLASADEALAQADDRGNKQDAEIERLTGLLVERERTIATLEERIRGMEAAARKAEADAQEKINKVTADLVAAGTKLGQAQGDLTKAKAEADAADKRAITAETLATAAKNETDRVRADLKEARDHGRSLQAKVDTLTTDLAAATTRANTAEARLPDLEAALKAAQALADERQRKVERLSAAATSAPGEQGDGDARHS